MGCGEVEAGPRARPAPQRRGAAGQAAQLAARRAAAVRADRKRVEACDLGQLERLREVPRRDLDLVAGFAQAPHERAEDDRVGGRREIDPDPHRRAPTRATNGLAAAEGALDGGQPLAILARLGELALEARDVRHERLRRHRSAARAMAAAEPVGAARRVLGRAAAPRGGLRRRRRPWPRRAWPQSSCAGAAARRRRLEASAPRGSTRSARSRSSGRSPARRAGMPRSPSCLRRCACAPPRNSPCQCCRGLPVAAILSLAVWGCCLEDCRIRCGRQSISASLECGQR